MQGLKIIVVVMGVMIVAGVAVVIGTIVQRSGGTTAAILIDGVLDEPASTRIAGIAVLADRLAVQLQGGGPDRVLLLDPRSGRVMGRIALAR